MLVERRPALSLASAVHSYYGFSERTQAPVRRREGPGTSIVVILAFEDDWLIDGERRTSFAGGLRHAYVTTEHQGRSLGMQINLAPLAARALFDVPMCELADRTVPLEDVLSSPHLVEQLASAPDWQARFELVDRVLLTCLPSSFGSRAVDWAWRRLQETHGGVAVGDLARELGWSRKPLVARFRDQIGLPPKTAARLLRFEHARALAGTMPWAQLAIECGFYDQSHLINEFKAISGRTPETFLQDTSAIGA